MDWLKELFSDPTRVDTSLLILALVIVTGLVVGGVAIRGIRLGVAGILFTGLAFSHFGLAPNATVLSFAREFGLVLFVFTVGLSVGPGFFNALRREGLSLNLLTLAVVFLGVVITVAAITVGGIAGPIAIGLFSGATTNTPSLAAAGQALRERPPSDSAAQAALAQVVPDHPLVRQQTDLTPDEREQLLAEVAKLPGMAYALSYPGGVLGIIAAIVLLRWIFRVNPAEEVAEWERQRKFNAPPLANLLVRVTNPNLSDILLSEIPACESLGIVISRVIRGTEGVVANPNIRLECGDILLAVGQQHQLEQFCRIVGEPATIDFTTISSQIKVRWIVVSRKQVATIALGDLDLNRRFGVQLTRLRRTAVELPPRPDLRLLMGDEICVVGMPDNIACVAAEFGDSPRTLSEPELLPVFLGIALGVVLGSIPVSLPGVSGTLKLGLAGGPLLAAILLSGRQRIGPVVWYLPRTANLTLRDVGIALFLAAVGLKSGDLFVAALVQGSGLKWLATGAFITLAPLLVVGCIARFVVRQHYLTIIGMVAGSMTDPPALAFANSITKSELPSVSYATVYPLAMIARIVCAQLLMMWWAG